MYRPIIAIAIYLVVQLVCSLPLAAITAVQTVKTGSLSISPELLSWSLIASSVITIVVLHIFKFINVLKPGICHLKAKTASVAILSVVLLMFASSVLTEWMQLENLMADQFLAMSLTVPGMIAIGIVGPIAEEYVFREAIQGGMLRHGARPWLACTVSAFVFGLVHGNPAQIPFAFLVGLVFALVYMHTRSIVPVIICHIINNSTSVVLMNVYRDTPDVGFNDMLGLTPTIIAFVLSLVVGLLLLLWFIKQSKA